MALFYRLDKKQKAEEIASRRKKAIGSACKTFGTAVVGLAFLYICIFFTHIL